MRTRSDAGTDVGRRRDNNEDAYYVSDDVGLYAVADGVGGHNAGEVASSMFVKEVEACTEQYAELAREAEDNPMSVRDRVFALIDGVFQRSSTAIFDSAQADPDRAKMATTGVIVGFLDGYAAIGHVGDSRAYLIRDGEVRQLTKDHSLANDLLDQGVMKAEQLKTFPYKNVITRAVGPMPACKVDLLWHDAVPGDRFVLASDGLTNHVADEELPALAAKGAKAAIAAANSGGGTDNITVAIVQVKRSSRVHAVTTDGCMNALQSLELFKELTPHELLKMVKIVREEQRKTGEVLVREGDTGDRIYALVKGTLQVVKGGVVLAELHPGDHFGEIAFMDAKPRSASVISTTPTTLLAIDRDAFMQLMRSEPTIAIKALRCFATALADRLRTLADDFVKQR